MLQPIMNLLRSARRGDRLNGWTQLRQDFTGSQTSLSRDQWELLTAQLMDEEDEAVQHMGTVVMIGLAGPPSVPAISTAPSVPTKRDVDGSVTSLANWLWQPFEKKSAVFGLTECHYRRRDEVAIIPLARHLCRHDFPKTDIHFMYVDDPRWDQLLFDRRYRALCFVGRMGIFGSEGTNRWGNGPCRFGFSMDHRPKHLKAGELDKDYHCITEQLANGKKAVHRTEERNGVRLDFGVVQRYLVRDGARHVPVLACAGGSALGTLGATMWATKELTEPLYPDDPNPLPTPPGLEIGSRFEALVQVTADITSYAWQPKQIELCNLYAGKYAWSNDERTWQRLAKTHIAVVIDDGKVMALRFDGELSTLNSNSQNFRLLAQLFQGVLRSGDGVVDVAQLAQDQTIWNGRTRSEQEVRKLLSNLKFRYLHDSIVIGETVTINAEVTQQDKDSP